MKLSRIFIAFFLVAVFALSFTAKAQLIDKGQDFELVMYSPAIVTDFYQISIKPIVICVIIPDAKSDTRETVSVNIIPNANSPPSSISWPRCDKV